jgi:hypothetical protein
MSLSEWVGVYLIFILFAFDDELFDGVGGGEFLSVEDGDCVFIADDEDVQGEVVVELFQHGQCDVLDHVLLEVEPLKTLRVVLHQNALALGLTCQIITYLSCLTIAQIIEFHISRQMMLSWVRLTSLGAPSIFLDFSGGISMRRVTHFFLPSF